MLHAMRQRRRAVSGHALPDAICARRASRMALRCCYGHGQPGCAAMSWWCILGGLMQRLDAKLRCDDGVPQGPVPHCTSTAASDIVHQIVPNTRLYSPLTPIVPVVLPTASDVMERAYWHMVTARPWALHTESREKGKRGDACVCAAGRGDASFRSWYAAGTGSPSSNEVTEADSCSLDVSSGELEP